MCVKIKGITENVIPSVALFSLPPTHPAQANSLEIPHLNVLIESAAGIFPFHCGLLMYK